MQPRGRICLPAAESHECARLYLRYTGWTEPAIVDQPAINLNSGYIRRGIDLLPRQGARKPWKFHQNYALDMLDLRFERR